MYSNGLQFDLYKADIPKYTNLLDPSIINVGKMFDADNFAWWTTDYIDVEGGKYLYPQYLTQNADYATNIVTKTVTVHAGRIAFYDSSKKQVYAYTSAQTAPVPIPNDAKYVRVVWGTGTGHRVIDDAKNARYFFVGVSATNEHEKMPWEFYYKYGDGVTVSIEPSAMIANPLNPLYSKHIVMFGDSLTDAYGGHFQVDEWEADAVYPYPRLAQEFGFTFKNLAHGGSNISTHGTAGYTDKNGCVSLDAYLSKVETGEEKPADIIIIAFGTNEYAQYAGTAEDTSETKTTFCGAMKYFIEQIREKLPMCQIGVVLPPFSDWAKSGNTYKDPVTCVEAFLPVLQMEGYNVPYIDMRYGTGITSAMASDGIHVNRDGVGRELYYRALRRFLMGL